MYEALEEALNDYGNNVIILPTTIGQSVSQYHTMPYVLAKVGTEHGPAEGFLSRLHWHTILTFHDMLTSRRVSESS